MVWRCENLVRPTDRESPILQKLERVDRSVVSQVARYMQQRLAVIALDDRVRVPNLFIKCLQ